MSGSEVVQQAWVYADGNAVNPKYVLELRGTVTSGVRFDRPTLDFGRVPSRTGVVKVVRVRIDRALYDPTKTTLAVTNGQSLRIQRLTNAMAQPGTADRQSPHSVVCSFRVSIPPGTPAGPLNGTLFVEGLKARHQSVNTPPPAIAFLGEVSAGVVAEPKMAVFGLVRHLPVDDGAAKAGVGLPVRWILLSEVVSQSSLKAGKTRPQSVLPVAGLSVVSITSNNPAFNAELVEGSSDSNQGKSLEAVPPIPVSLAHKNVVRWLKVTVTPEAPMGQPLSGTITLTFTNGERLQVPVLAQLEAPVKTDGPIHPLVGQPVPAISLMDTEGRPFGVRAVDGKPAVLFFFCGCDACRACATEWAQLQRSGALKLSPSDKSSSRTEPATAIIYSGSSNELKSFSLSTNLYLQDTVLLPDPMMVATQQYKVDPCPRVFVIDGKGMLRYTNNHGDDQPQKAPTAAIIARTVDALRSAQAAK